MSAFKVRLHDRALREFVIADLWWRTNRIAAPGALAEEFEAVRDLLSRHPQAGRVDADRGGKIRRIVLIKTRYVVYYRIGLDDRVVDILSPRHASRRAPRTPRNS